MARRTRVALLTRETCTGPDGTTRTLFFTMPGGGCRRSITAFGRPEHVLEFERRQAWFELELVSDRPWSCWRAAQALEATS